MSATALTMPSVLFIALDTYSRTGGLQRFNRRVVAALGQLTAKAGAAGPLVHIMRDSGADLPADVNATLVGFGPKRLRLVRASLAALPRTDLLILGHINLLPIGALCKLLRPKLKLLLFVHGDEVWDDPVYRRKRPYEPLLLKLVDRIASVSDFTARRMTGAFGVSAKKFRLLPNAVDPVAAPPTFSGRTVLTVTRLNWHDRGKNIDAVIRAVGLLRDRNVEARLEIIGEGPIRPELEQLTAELNLQDRVRFLGRVSDAEMAEAYGRTRVFAMPSSKEGFGIVYLEAWQRGVPVICGTEDAAHEIITDGEDGYAVDPRHVSLLAERIAGLLDNPALAAEMGRRGANKVTSRYLMSHFEANLKTLLAEMR